MTMLLLDGVGKLVLWIFISGVAVVAAVRYGAKEACRAIDTVHLVAVQVAPGPALLHPVFCIVVFSIFGPPAAWVCE